jgi:hypothetical protein
MIRTTLADGELRTPVAEISRRQHVLGVKAAFVVPVLITA